MEQILQEVYEMACHNLLCCSKNYAMTEPKPGREAEWQAAKLKVEHLEQLKAGIGSLKAGDTVITPVGVGLVHKVEGDRIVVEMDLSYLVEFSVWQVGKYSGRCLGEGSSAPGAGANGVALPEGEGHRT